MFDGRKTPTYLLTYLLFDGDWETGESTKKADVRMAYFLRSVPRRIVRMVYFLTKKCAQKVDVRMAYFLRSVPRRIVRMVYFLTVPRRQTLEWHIS